MRVLSPCCAGRSDAIGDWRDSFKRVANHPKSAVTGPFADVHVFSIVHIAAWLHVLTV